MDESRKFNWRYLSAGIAWGIGIGIIVVLVSVMTGYVEQTVEAERSDFESCAHSCLEIRDLRPDEQVECVKMCVEHFSEDEGAK